MPTIDEVLKKADEVGAERDKLAAELKALKATPDLSGIHRDDGGRIVGGWEDTDETATIVSGYEGKGERAKRSSIKSAQKAMRSLVRQGYRPWGEFKSFADFCRSGFEGHQTSAFRDRCKSHFKAVQGMSEAIGSDGGFGVMPEFNTQVFEHVYGNSLYKETDNYTVGGNNMTFLANAETSRANGSRHGGLRGYWTAEGQTITSSKPTIREIQMKLQKLCVLVYLTDELLSDTGQALEQYVARKAAEEFEFMIGDAIFNGTSVGQPTGILNSPSLLSITKEVGQLTATIVTENVAKMYARFFQPYFGNAKWYHNQDCLAQLHLMTLGIGTAGVPTNLPPSGVAGAPNNSIYGRPMQPIEFCSTVGTAGDLTLADLSQVLSISKGGISQAVSMHVEFLTDQLALRFTMRLNAQPWENAPITPYKGSATQSSFVTIANRP